MPDDVSISARSGACAAPPLSKTSLMSVATTSTFPQAPALPSERSTSLSSRRRDAICTAWCDLTPASMSGMSASKTWALGGSDESAYCVQRFDDIDGTAHGKATRLYISA
eukprot:7355323-Prymnesium_polylepis.2